MSSSVSKPIIKQIKDRQDALDFFEHVSLPKNMISNTQITAQPEYDIQFWNAMRNKEAREDILANGRDISAGTYSMPTVAAVKVMNEIEKESDFRKIATVIRAYKNCYRIFAKDCKDKAEFVAEGAAIPVYESAGDFNEKTIESYKLASIVTLDGEDFLAYYGERKLIFRVAFERYLRNHPELRRRV